MEYRKKQELIAMQKIEAERFRKSLMQKVKIKVLSQKVRISWGTGSLFDIFRKTKFHAYILYFDDPITPKEFKALLKKGFGDWEFAWEDLEEKEEKEA